MDFTTTSDLWRVRQEVRVELHTLSHPRLLEFSRWCQRLLTKIESAYPDDFFWRRYGSVLKRIRFDLAANPLPFDAASPGAPETVRDSRDGLVRRKRVYPDLAEEAIALVDAAELLVTSKEEPLLAYLYLEELLETSNNEQVGLVVTESRYLPSLKGELAALDVNAVRTLTPTRLKRSEKFDRLLFIGPTTWFPDHVMASPRAPSLTFLHFDWLGPDHPPRSLSPGPEEGTWEAQGFSTSRSSPTAVTERPSQPMLDIVPRVDWNLILDELGETRAQSNEVSDTVPARLCGLEGDASVFLRGHDGAETSVLSIDQKQVDVSWVPVAELQPGDFLLLRTTGGGDHVAELAWTYLGEKAEDIRIAQTKWKQELSDAIRARGAERVSREITANGARAASAGNVLAWASEERIQPGAKEDFIALLKTLGLDDKAEMYWKYGRAIFRARIKAGFRIRKLLLDQVRKADIERLDELGRTNFRLPGRHGGKMTALRLSGLAPFVVDVPAHRIGILFEAPEP